MQAHSVALDRLAVVQKVKQEQAQDSKLKPREGTHTGAAGRRRPAGSATHAAANGKAPDGVKKKQKVRVSRGGTGNKCKAPVVYS